MGAVATGQVASSVTVHDVIRAFRESSASNRERGGKFERLMAQYLRLDPTFGFSQVWMWGEWPGRDGRPDTGVDLVAVDGATGGHTAIQCKFYEPSHTIAKPDIDSFLAASGKAPFTSRLIISTTDKWGLNAEESLRGQSTPVQRIGLAEVAAAPVDWSFAGEAEKLQVTLKPAARHQLRPHQRTAVEAVMSGLATHGRGKLVMACGSGKTFTALKIAERTAQMKDGPAHVLFLVPSISLLSQTLREWTAQTETPMRVFAVCSDPKVSRRTGDSEDINVHDLARPATTDPGKLMADVAASDARTKLTVVFSTYQSVDVVAEAQRRGLPEFDLVVADEAHRTTGVTLAGADESAFVKVHDNEFLRSRQRLYMTATPRIFAEDTKAAATDNDAVITSMDDEAVYGPELHRLGFGEAVERGLLTDYKVLVLAVDESLVAGPLQQQLAGEGRELTLDDAAKIVGCWNGLAKRTTHPEVAAEYGQNPRPMQRAVAFCRDIRTSTHIAAKFPAVVEAYEEIDETVLACEVRHVDGTMNALRRNHELEWLKAPLADNECRILSNARCLSEGVDVPGLDAVLFLNPRNSIVDVVQSVGRVMRRAKDKDYGYIILPVAVPAGVKPSVALADNRRFKVVWEVLQALRAHDDRFNATVNKINYGSSAAKKKLLVDVLTGPAGEWSEGEAESVTGDADGSAAPVAPAAAGRPSTAEEEAREVALKITDQIELFGLQEWRDAIYARIVDKVGTRTYWEDWAKDVADIAAAQQARIRALLGGADTRVAGEFERFVQGLRANINDTIGPDQAVEMLSQHLITKPVFDALFEGYDFAARNPVSQVMEHMVDALHDQALEAETARLGTFYDSVRMRAADIDDAAGKQRVIIELYERFFKVGFAKQAAKLGVVYTPVEVVDFILRAADDALRAEFGRSLSDEGVHVLDPFTGTGTFIVRLLQSGIVRAGDLLRKYTAELHANEIMLLAYYIAAVNIEATFHGVAGGGYRPFEGIVLTDTFASTEHHESLGADLFPQNNARLERQRNTPITVIVGNPPYSSGQDSANDNNANEKYEDLDKRIEETYAARSTATNKNSLYDSYIRAIRWATDRLGDTGVLAYVSNGGWIDSNTADGIRLALADEFSALYVYNLRGNQRTAGEQSRKEGGKVFGSGSRNTVAILVAVKNPARTGPAHIRYRDIGDYLTREQKLATLAAGTLDTVPWRDIEPNQHGDWASQRSTSFATYPPLGEKPVKGQKSSLAVFWAYSRGLETTRDAWVYNYSRAAVEANVKRMIANYDALRPEFREFRAANSIARPTQSDVVNGKDGFLDDKNQPHRTATKSLSWSRSLRTFLIRDTAISYESGHLTTGMYRPFTKQVAYYDKHLNHERSQLPRIFPTRDHPNLGFYLVGMGSAVPFSVLMTDALPDLHLTGAGSGGQFFPRWVYEETALTSAESDTPDLFSTADDEDGVGQRYRRVDNITDGILRDYRASFGPQVTKDDIFHYVYGVLHSPQYRETFAADLRKMLPRIPKAAGAEDFTAFADAGRRLADLHTGYESADPHPLAEELKGGLGGDDWELYRVQKMAWGSRVTKDSIRYNARLTLTGVPEEAHRYTLGAKSALEWLIDRYQVKTDKPSGIVNDPNGWCREHNNPRHIVDLIKRVTTVSIKTTRIVDELPQLPL